MRTGVLFPRRMHMRERGRVQDARRGEEIIEHTDMHVDTKTRARKTHMRTMV